ncbi:MAG TPA: hypothetical protein VNP98_02990 [Chthoniobacterales bacterium]|nr:hypothetical protein [Chthoniobacterales bacterium]
MNPPPPATQDEQHLRLLSIFYYIVGGLTALIACFPLIHLGLGLAMLFSPEFFSGKSGEQPPPAIIGGLFTCIGGCMFLAGQALAVSTLLSGRFLARRTRYWFVFVVACIQCALFPFGTVLGVFTIITLSRESVKALFHLTPSATTAVT